MPGEFDLTELGAALGTKRFGASSAPQSTVNLTGLDPNLMQALDQARTAYRQQFGTDMPITSGVRTRADQERLYADYKAGKPGIFMPLDPFKYPGQQTFHADAVDIPPSVPESFLNQFGIHRPLGKRDPVHAVLMPRTANQQPAQPSQPAQPGNAPTQEFDLSGLQSALVSPAAAAQTTQPGAPGAPGEPKPSAMQQATQVVPRMFEPKTELDKKIISVIEGIPGSKEIGAFANVAGGTVSKSISAIQQLVGKYFPGLDDETRDKIMANAQQNIETVNKSIAPFQVESPKSAIAGEVTGYVVNPANKLVPGFGAAPTTLTGATLKAAGQGAVANVLTQPVEDQSKSFTTQKIEQALTGGVFGGGFGAGLHLLTTGLGRSVDAVRKRFGNNVPASEMDNAAAQVLRDAGVDATKVPPEYFRGLQDQAMAALKTGDIKSFQRFARNYTEANQLGVPMLRGQLTRDPMQYAVEQNLRGIQGVGEPIQKVLQDQNTALLRVLDNFGATKGQSITTSGFTVRNALRQADATDAKKVSDAYAAFRASTGKNIDVPLQGMAQDYARVLHDYGNTIPQGVRNNFEELGLLTGKQLKVTTIDDAENLIKVINKHYDKSNLAQANALDELRTSVNKAINDAGANLPGEAGQLARQARDTATKRFTTIEGIPALRDAFRGKEPDKFVQNHILQGNVDQISKMSKYLQENNPEALAQIQNDVIRHIKNRVTNNVSDQNAKFSQAGLKEFVTGPMGDRLKRFLTPEQFNGLNALNRVAENALVEPVAAAVNKSNTASAAANFVKGTVQAGAINELLTNIAGINFPLAAWASRELQQRNQRARAGELINQAITPTAPPATAPIRAMVKPGVPGAGLGVGTVQQRNVEFEDQRNR